jgi:hypothetical protein
MKFRESKLEVFLSKGIKLKPIYSLTLLIRQGSRETRDVADMALFDLYIICGECSLSVGKELFARKHAFHIDVRKVPSRGKPVGRLSDRTNVRNLHLRTKGKVFRGSRTHFPSARKVKMCFYLDIIIV